MTDPCARTLAGTNVAMTVLAALLEARTGQQLASYRSWRLDTALKPLLRERGLEPAYLDGAKTGALMKKDVDMWRDIVGRLKLSLD